MSTNQKQHEPKRARTKKGTNQKEHETFPTPIVWCKTQLWTLWPDTDVKIKSGTTEGSCLMRLLDPNGKNWFKLDQIGFKWTKSKWLELFKLDQNGSIWFKMDQIGYNFIQIDQTFSNWMKLVQTCPNLIKLDQTESNWLNSSTEVLNKYRKVANTNASRFVTRLVSKHTQNDNFLI